MMMLPPFAPFPPASLQSKIPPEEWQLCLNSFIVLAQRNLLLSSEQFSLQVVKDISFVEFLVSYFRELAATEKTSQSASARRLRRECFLLLHRILMELKPVPPALLEWASLGDVGIVYPRSESLRELLESVWGSEELDKNVSMQDNKKFITQLLEASGDTDSSKLDLALRRAAALLKASYHYGQFLMLGSDFLDSLSTAYKKGTDFMKKKAEIIGYLCLTSLLDSRRPNFSTLLDHLYTLHSTSHHDSLCKGICSNTPLLQRMREQLSGPERERGKGLMSHLSVFEKAKENELASRKIDKGKGKDEGDYGNGLLEDVHTHKLSLVTQVQDLFPDLGSGFVAKLLDEYDDNTEQVTAHLLDDSLPQHLKYLDRAEDLTDPPPIQLPQSHNDITLPARRNFFDDDAFDRLAIAPSSLTLGRANPTQTADSLLAAPPSNAKAAILSALAAFDPDSDERDDTYDAEDVGGNVDSALPGSDERDADLRDGNEEALLAAYKRNPELFDRDAMTRRDKARAALKSETGMTDEAIEGWAIMIGRDPRRLRRLEAKFSVDGGTQRELVYTSYRESASAVDDDSEAAESGSGRNGGRGRGRRRGGRVGGGNVAGPAGDKETQVARQRKGVAKGERANHNRRDQRARKMAKGGFPG